MDNPISDLMYDWITVLHAKAKGIHAYERFLKDAQAENSQECIELLSKLRDQDIRMVDEVARHVGEMFGKDFADVVARSRRPTDEPQVAAPAP